MGVFMRMRENYRDHWSGHVATWESLRSGQPSWSRFFGCLVVFLVLTVAIVAAVARPPIPRLGWPLFADIIFGAAAIHQWRKLRRLRVNAPPPRQKRHRKTFHS